MFTLVHMHARSLTFLSTFRVCLDIRKWRERKGRDLKSLAWITKRGERDLERYNGFFLLRYQSFQSWKDLKGQLIPLPFLSFSSKQTRVSSLLFLFPFISFPPFSFLTFLFSPKLQFKHNVRLRFCSR